MRNSAASIGTTMNSFERRLHDRKAGAGSIFFASPKRIYEGTLVNHSSRGLAIRVSDRFVIGEVLIIALPFDNAVPPKCKARVVWCNGKGLGVKFVR